MKKIIEKIFKTIYYFVLIILVLCVCSIVYNKIKYPKSPFTVFGYQLYVDVTNSMVPDLHVNDIIIVKKCSKENINVGDIVTFREGNTTVTHRIIEIINDDGKIKYKTKGDNNNLEDDKPITYKEIEGKYCFKIRYLGFFITDKVSCILLILLILILSHFPYSKLNFSKKEEEIVGSESVDEKIENLNEEVLENIKKEKKIFKN